MDRNVAELELAEAAQKAKMPAQDYLEMLWEKMASGERLSYKEQDMLYAFGT